MMIVIITFGEVFLSKIGRLLIWYMYLLFDKAIFNFDLSVKDKSWSVQAFWHQEVAKKVGEVIAKSCLEKGITKVAFDRGGYPYHGRVEALANAARENGLQF